jgi:hypothetical protein
MGKTEIVMAYYKTKLNEDSPPHHSGAVVSYDKLHGTGLIQGDTGTVYPFSSDDLLAYGIFVKARVLFGISRNGIAINISKIKI